MFFPEDRTAIHEIGHAEIAFIFSGVASQIDLKGPGGSCSTPLAYSFQRWDFAHGDVADWLFALAFDLGGPMCEKLCYGSYDVGGCADDYHKARAALAELWSCKGYTGLTLTAVEEVVYHMLARHAGVLGRAVKQVSSQRTTDGRRLSETFASDRELSRFWDTPLLSGDFERKWAQWQAYAGVQRGASGIWE